MVKLVPAKCPSCGVQLKLDDNLKRTECKYCNTTIIVDDAIENYKIELKGKVSVDGIKGSNSFIEEAKKDLKLKNYYSAEANCNKVIQELDKYNDEAHIIKLKITIEQIKDIENFEEKVKEGDTNSWMLLEELEKKDKALKTVIKANDSASYVNKVIGKDKELVEEVLKYKETYKDKTPYLEGMDSHDTEKSIQKAIEKFEQFRDYSLEKYFSEKIFGYNIILHDPQYNINNNTLRYWIDDHPNEIDLSEKYKTPIELYNTLITEYDNMNKLSHEYRRINERLSDFLFLESNYNLKAKKSSYLKNQFGINISQAHDLSKVTFSIDLMKYDYYDYDLDISSGSKDNKLSIEEIDKILDDFSEFNGKSNLFKYISYIVRAVIILSMWMYILSDIGESFSKPDLLTPVAALVYIGIGVAVSIGIWALLGSIFNTIQRKVVK